MKFCLIGRSPSKKVCNSLDQHKKLICTFADKNFANYLKLRDKGLLSVIEINSNSEFRDNLWRMHHQLRENRFNKCRKCGKDFNAHPIAKVVDCLVTMSEPFFDLMTDTVDATINIVEKLTREK